MEELLSLIDLRDKIITLRGQQVMLDADVASLYGVETKRINEAVKNNPQKFPVGYVLEVSNQELARLKSKFSTSNNENWWKNSTSYEGRGGVRKPSKFFTERGLYMLATILKSERATQATLSIVETFAKVRELKRELLAMHQETDPSMHKIMMDKFGNLLSDIVMPDLKVDEAESSLEINFFIGKLKHTVKRRRTKDDDETN